MLHMLRHGGNPLLDPNTRPLLSFTYTCRQLHYEIKARSRDLKGSVKLHVVAWKTKDVMQILCRLELSGHGSQLGKVF
jgi:hypothetical protein